MDMEELTRVVARMAVVKMFGLDRATYLRYLAEASKLAGVSPLDVKDKLDLLIEELVLKMLHPLKHEELAEIIRVNGLPETTQTPKPIVVPGGPFDPNMPKVLAGTPFDPACQT